MTEADEVAETLLTRYVEHLANRGGIIATQFNAREFIKAQYPNGDWQDWLSHVQLDNVASSLFKMAS